MWKTAFFTIFLIFLVPSLILAQGVPGLKIIVSDTTDVIAYYRGNSASYNNDLYFGLTVESANTWLFNNKSSAVGDYVNLGSFPVGTELIFRLHVNDTGYDYFTGPAERNPDGQPHARVEEEWQPSETLVGFEDKNDFDYNDLMFSFTNTAATVVVCDAGGPYAGNEVGDPIQFDGSGSYATNSTIVSYEWDFGDGNTGSGVTPTHAYNVAGVYTVTLCVTNEFGDTSCCETLAEQPVESESKPWGSIKNLYH